MREGEEGRRGAEGKNNVEGGRKEGGGGKRGVRRKGGRAEGDKNVERGREVRQEEGRRKKEGEIGWKMEPRVTYYPSVCSVHQYASLSSLSCLCTVRQLPTTNHWLLVYILTNLT